MKEKFVQNRFYEISIDREKNRVYLKIIGFWRTKEEVSSYVKDLGKALMNVKPNYTLLTDLSEMKTHPVEMHEVHMEAQKLLVERGLSQTAEVYQNSFVQCQADRISKKSQMPLKQFTSKEEAERFLDLVLV